MTQPKSKIVKVRNLKRVTYQPGDLFVLTCPHYIDPTTAQRLKTELRKWLPGKKIIVLGDGIEIGVLGKGKP